MKLTGLEFSGIDDVRRSAAAYRIHERMLGHGDSGTDRQFYRFATTQLESGSSDLSIDELYDRWRLEACSDEEFEENVASVQQAIADMQQGDTGCDASEAIAAVRKQFGLPVSE